MPERYGTGLMNRGFGYCRRSCRDDFKRNSCIGYRMGYRYKSRKEFLKDHKDFLIERLEEVDAELESLK